MKLMRMAALATTASLFMAMPILAGEFSGKGNRLDWGYALEDYNQGNHYFNHGRFEEAIDRYNKAIARYPYDPDFYANLGTACAKINEYTAAEEALKKACQLNAKDWVPWSNLANIYSKQNKLKEALPIFERTLKCTPAPPAEDMEAIKGNIQGIRRILKAQGQLDEPAPGKASAVKKVAGKSAKPPSAKAAVPTQQDDSLKKSGWDYSR